MAITEQLEALAREWDRAAKQYDRKAEGVNRSACYDGQRQLQVGLAAASRAHAAQLRDLIAGNTQEAEA